MNIVVVASRSRSLFTSLREMLGQDFDLQFADRLSQVFDALAKGPADLVFVDSRLADCEGRDAVREIASVFPETSLIYLVPPEDGRVCPVSEEKGVYAYLWKPLQKEIVHFLAGKAVERRKLARRIEYLSSLAGKGAAENSARPNDRSSPSYPAATSGVLRRGMVRKLLRSVSAITDLNELLARFADSVRELFGSNNVAIFTWDSIRGRYVAGAWQGVDEGLAEVCSFSKTHGMVRWLVEHQQLLTRDKLQNSFPHDVAVEVGTDMHALRSEIIMPLLERGNLIGFLSLGRKMTGKRYDEEDLELLAVIGDCASGAISTALMYRELSVQKTGADAILDNIACGIVGVDASSRITSMNRFAEGALNVSAAELIGKSVQKLGSVLADMVLRGINENQTFANRSYRDAATGRVFAVSTSRICDEKSNCVGVILFFTAPPEVTTVTPGEDEMPEGEDFADFCAHIADKVKNPLASIKTFSQLLPEKFEDTEFRQKFTEIVGKAVNRINSLADGLTAYASAGPLDQSPTNIAAVVENTVAALRNSLGGRNLRVAALPSEKPAMVLADGQLIRSAFLNVLKNSIESTPPDGQITISLREVSAKDLRNAGAKALVFDSTGIGGTDMAVLDDEVFVEAEFRDSGKGIPRDDMRRIGQMFFTTKGQNIGLGLAISRRIVSRHRGRMEIESKQGEGTTVRIILPREHNTG